MLGTQFVSQILKAGSTKWNEISLFRLLTSELLKRPGCLVSEEHKKHLFLSRIK